MSIINPVTATRLSLVDVYDALGAVQRLGQLVDHARFGDCKLSTEEVEACIAKAEEHLQSAYEGLHDALSDVEEEGV